jgi:hypothetical protein
MDNIHQDLLADCHKLSYGKYKSGLMERPPGYEDAIEKEQDMISSSMTTYVDCTGLCETCQCRAVRSPVVQTTNP